MQCNRLSPESARRILIVDDDQALRRLLKVILKDDYRIDEAASGEEALQKVSTFDPGIILLDVLMPGIDGYETCRRIKAVRSDIQVIMVSAISSSQQQLRAFEVGADDYMIKPFDTQDLRARVRLHVHFQESMAGVAAIRAEIDSRNAELKQLAEQRMRDIVAIQDTAVFTLAKVAESRDQETGGHLARMRAYAQILAKDLATAGPYADQIDSQFLEDLYRSSPLHDIGKVGIRDEILLKPGRLTPEEFQLMQQHSAIGANILDEAVLRTRGGGFLAMAAVIARHHHEKFDGSGYPAGLAGEEIPLAARIVAVADAYDALTSVRPYKPAYAAEEAHAIIVRDSGRHFDPAIIAAFCRCFDDFLCVRDEALDDFAIGYSASSFREYELAAISG